MPRFASPILQLLLLICFVLPCSAASPPLFLQAGTSSVSLGGHIDILEDQTGKLTIDEVISPENEGRFRQDKRAVPSFGITKSVYWIRFTMTRADGAESLWLLELAAPQLYYLDLYQPQQDGSLELMQAGSMRPMSIRKYQHRNPVFPVNIHANTQTFYLRADGRVFTQFPMTVWSPNAFATLNHQRDLFYGCFFGAILVMCSYHFFLFVSLRDRNYLYYVFDIFFLALFEFAVKGFLIESFAAEAPWLNQYAFALGAPAIYFALLFARSFLSTSVNVPAIDKAMRVLMLASLLLIPSTFALPPAIGRLVVAIVALCSTIILLVAGIACHRKGYHPARYFLGARIFRIIGLIMSVLALYRILPWNFMTTFGMQIGLILEVVILSFALADRINVMRQEKEAAEAESIRAARESEQKAVELAKEMTIDLREALAGEQRALERQNRFMAMLSHEYRTPLAIIQANLDLMELREPEPGGHNEPRLSNMRHAVGRLVEVMEVSMQKERLNGFHVPAEMERIDMIPFLDAVIDSAEGLWPERFFIFQPETESAVVAGESGVLKTALFNLLDNACKYSAPHDPVIIDCSTDNGKVAITIQDRGKGISQGETARVFEKYYRGSSSSDTSGAGVGLWLVRQIVEQYGGTVALQRQSDGPGTAAVICLPLVL